VQYVALPRAVDVAAHGNAPLADLRRVVAGFGCDAKRLPRRTSTRVAACPPPR